MTSRKLHRFQSTRQRPDPVSEAQGDDGFTLIELLIVLVILPLIIGGVAAAVIAELNNTSQSDARGTYVRLADSHDTQITSAYFVRDVQSASSVSTNTSTSLCPTDGSQTQVLGLSWKDGSIPVAVSYGTSTSAPFTLIRRYCQGSNPEVDSTIAHQVFPRSLPSVTLTNSGGVCAAGVSSCATETGTNYVSVTVNCTDGSVTCADPGPIKVVHTPGHVGVSSVHMSVLDNLVTRYQYGLTGVPRLANSANTGQPPSAPPSPPFISNGPIQAGNCNILSNGLAVSNATSGTALSVGPTGSLNATGFYSAGGTTSGSGYYPTPVDYGDVPIPSPYQYLSEAAPPAVPPPPGPPVGAGYTVIPETQLNWDPSTLPQPLAPAIYWVQNGLNVSGNKGVEASNGVLFYVTGGSVTLAGKGNIDLSPLSPNWEQTTNGSPAPSPEVVLWISQYDKTPNPPGLTLGGNGGAVTINGAVYAPTAALTLHGGGSSGGISTQALDVGSISSCDGGGDVPFDLTVGSHLSSGTFDQPTAPTITLTMNDTASVTVTGVGHLAPTGTASVSVCGPEPAPPTGCGQVPPPIGQPSPVLVDANVSLTPNNTTGTATGTSLPFTPLTPGWYCFTASYPGNVSYQSSSDTSPDGCFDVAGPPTIVLSAPVNGGCYTAGPDPTCLPGLWLDPSITGSAADAGGPGISQVTVTIQNAKGDYWNGTKFAPSTFQLPAATADGWATWSLSFPSADFPKTGSYTVTASATDSNNVASAPAIAIFTWK